MAEIGTGHPHSWISSAGTPFFSATPRIRVGRGRVAMQKARVLSGVMQERNPARAFAGVALHRAGHSFGALLVGKDAEPVGKGPFDYVAGHIFSRADGSAQSMTALPSRGNSAASGAPGSP
jgi:hypothetical protein